ncbi:nucleoside recognition domain-containing protein [Salsuginibacillus kocurii]|uniref:nucleoside recognition domain-containing protein n=1 Tax=Salsuginibacillus kocurii TaxID=427078 RepID=UPI000375F98C|nr:nucleoside recognition domain-containing protein [Salsuginibacillus kocurii]
MINVIWAGLLITGILYAAINGTMDQVNEAIFTGAEQAVTLCLGLISILVFWLGIMKIAERGGLLALIRKALSPLAAKLYPEVPRDHPALGYMISNMSANMLGLGNAATPLGIKAMEELKKLNGNKDEPSRTMITFLAMNTAGLTLVPTTVIAIRMNYGSVNPGEIIGTTLIATALSACAAIMIDRFFYHLRRRKERRTNG